MEECVFRAIPLSLGALIGARYGHRTLGIAIACRRCRRWCSAARTRTIRDFPRIRGPVELLLPSIVWALIYLRFGLLPTILLHATFDLALFSIPLFLVDAPGARIAAGAGDRRGARAAGRRRVAPARRPADGTSCRDSLGNGAWRAGAQRSDRPAGGCAGRRPPVRRISARVAGARRRGRRCLGALRTRSHADVPPLRSTARRDRRGGRGDRRAGHDARSAVAAVRDRQARERRSAAVDVAQVRLARGGPRSVSAPRRHDARAAVLGSALRDVRRRRRRARGGVARRGHR